MFVEEGRFKGLRISPNNSNILIILLSIGIWNPFLSIQDGKHLVSIIIVEVIY